MDDRLAAELAVFSGEDEVYVHEAYRLVLRRNPEPEALERADEAGERTLAGDAPGGLVGTAEHEQVRRLDDAVAAALGARRRSERLRQLAGPPWLDERIVGCHGVLSRLGGGAVLEVGYAFAEPACLAALVRAGVERLVAVDLVEREVPGSRPWSRTSASCRSSPGRSTRCCSSRRSSTSAPTTPSTAWPRAHRRCGGSAGGAPAGAAREGSPAGQRARGRARRSRLVPAGRAGRLAAAVRAAGFFVEEQEVYELTGARVAGEPRVPAGRRSLRRARIGCLPRCCVPS